MNNFRTIRATVGCRTTFWCKVHNFPEVSARVVYLQLIVPSIPSIQNGSASSEVPTNGVTMVTRHAHVKINLSTQSWTPEQDNKFCLAGARQHLVNGWRYNWESSIYTPSFPVAIPNSCWIVRIIYKSFEIPSSGDRISWGWIHSKLPVSNQCHIFFSILNNQVCSTLPNVKPTWKILTDIRLLVSWSIVR